MNLDQVKAIFLLAGFPECRFFEGVNPYWGDRYAQAGPQYAAICPEQGIITIHWRKRVLEINWSDTLVRYPLGDQWDRSYAIIHNLTEDDVTKGPTMVHAYSYGKAVDYLTQFRQHFQRAKYLQEFAIRKSNGTLTEEEQKDLKYYSENKTA